MLRELHIRDYALIKQLDLQFERGFTVLTGETGAGKSIILDCLGLLLGQRASAEGVRRGADHALVEGGFEVDPESELARFLRESGFAEEDGYLVISREISRTGRSKCRINGRIATVSMLGEIAPYLAEMHGQHDNQVLLRASSHIQWLDQLGGAELASLKAEVETRYFELVEKERALRDILHSERERAQRLDLLQFQFTEIAEAQLRPGEDEELAERRRILQNVEKLRGATQEAYFLMSGRDMDTLGIRDALSQAVERIAEASRYDASLQSLQQNLETVLYNVEEAMMTLRDYLEQGEVDPGELDRVEARYALIQQLRRKYGDTVEDILQYQGEIGEEITQLENADSLAAELEEEISRLKAALVPLVLDLSSQRREVAANLEKRVQEELAFLNMEKAVFVVEFDRHRREQTLEIDGEQVGVSADGIDNVQFLISANPGEAPQPLTKVASGGELARVMLALKSILAQVDSVATLVFDEVDTGIGGKAALAVAQRLARLGAYKQVLCVTHLPQVAAGAAHHFMVEKQVSEANVTTVGVNKLNPEQRLEELSRMLGGHRTEASLSHAAELMNMGQQWRNLTA